MAERRRGGGRPLTLGLLLLALACDDGDERSYRIGTVAVDAELAADGTLAVVEAREFVYDGTYTQAEYTLPLRDSQAVRDVSLSDSTEVTYREGDGEQPGTYAVEEDDGDFLLTWTYAQPATDESRTFTIGYEVTGAGARHADSAELYWQWVGTGWEVPTERLVADVRLPPGAAELAAGEGLRIFGHGPPHGTVEVIEPGVVRTAIEGVGAETFVELRAVFPPELLAQAPSDGQALRDAILAEETCLAVATDADRVRAQGGTPAEDCDPDAAGRRVAAVVAGVVTLLGLLAWLLLFLRKGREHRLPPDLPDGELAPPSDHPPALVAYLTSWGSIDTGALIATLLDLGRRGVLDLEQTPREPGPRRRRGRAAATTTTIQVRGEGATPWERQVVRLLRDLGGGGPVSDERLRGWAKADRKAARAWWRAWERAVKADGAARGWLEPRWPVAAGIAIAAVVVAAGVVALPFDALAAGVTALVVGVALAACTGLLLRRSPAGRELHVRWRRFAKELRRRSAAVEAVKSTDAVGDWSRDLVYAVPLGVAAPVLAGLDRRLGDDEPTSCGLGWYPWVHGSDGGAMAAGFEGFVGAIGGSLGPVSASATGAGGGFSGGGGGGSGGGGSGGGAS